jgi:hypothetical protein
MAALISIWEPSMVQWLGSQFSAIPLWVIFVVFYTVVSILALAVSIRHLRPILRKAR